MVFVGAARGQQAGSYPPFTGARLTVTADVPNRETYSGLEEQIRQVEVGSAQTYYVVVTLSTGSGSAATGDYVDGLFGVWRSQARERKLEFDPARSVLIVVALDNRQIAVYPGSQLQSRFGLRGGVIDRDLIRSKFAPLASAGSYPEAILALVKGTEEWINGKDPEAGARRQQYEQRMAAVRKDAEEALAAAKGTLEEARKELDEKRSGGLRVDDFQSRLGEADRQLQAIPGLVGTDAKAGLNRALDLRHEVEQVISGLRKRAADQVVAALAIESLPQKLAETGQKLDESRKAGLPVTAAAAALTGAQKSLEELRELLKSDPTAAIGRASELDHQNQVLGEQLAGLPDLMKRQQAALAKVEPLRGQVAKALTDAERGGTDIRTLRASFNKLEPGLEAAARADMADPARDVAALESAEPQLKRMLDEVAAARSRHWLYGRVLPLVLLGAAALGVLLILALVRTLHNQARRSAEGKYKAAREQATKLMERLDAIKERHKLLPATDPDFQKPLTGESLALYSSVEERLRTLWDHWLEIMETLDQAHGLIEKQSPLGSSLLKKAEDLIEEEGGLEETARQEQALTADLDTLNQAHEAARAVNEGVKKSIGEFEAKLGALSAAGIPVTPYKPEQDGVEGVLEQAESMTVEDPLQAKQVAERAASRMKALSDRVDEVHSRFQAAQATRKGIDEVTADVSAKRKGGLKLDEPEANPDPPLSQASKAQAGALESLQTGDTGTAAERLDAAGQALGRAKSIVEEVVQSRDSCGRLAKERAEAAARLREGLRPAELQMQDLQAHFAPASWQNAAHHLEAARERLDRADSDEQVAAKLADPGTQHYVEAARRHAEAAKAHNEAGALFEELSSTLNGLIEVRAECQKGLAELNNTASQVIALFEANRDNLGPGPRQALNVAQDAHRQTEQLGAIERPDWLAVRQWIARAGESYRIAREQAESMTVEDPLQAKQVAERAAQMKDVAADLDRSEQLATEDIRLSNRAIAGISEANRVIREARSYSSMGLSVDVSGAWELLQRAQHSLATQNYEQAIEAANTAEHQAREAYRAAETAARRRQEQIEWERRRRAASERARYNQPMPGLGPIIAGAALEVLMNAAGASGATTRGGGGWNVTFGSGAGGGGGGGGQSSSGGGGWTSGTSQSEW